MYRVQSTWVREYRVHEYISTGVRGCISTEMNILDIVMTVCGSIRYVLVTGAERGARETLPVRQTQR